MSSRYLLEIACNSAMSAVAAQQGGANRIELFENLEQGGTTPSSGSIAVARDYLQIPLFVLIRPRPGDFHYGALEAELMLRDIAHCRQLGCDGVVIGALSADAEIDMPLCRELVSAAGPMDITFHRAFDAARDLPTALEQIAGLGIKRILSSGGHASAAEGSAVLASLAEQAGSRLGLMAGAGLGAQNITEVALKTGCVQLHASAKGRQRSAMRYQNPRLQGLDNDWIQTESSAVAALRGALDQLG
ncbi:MAG: copper homeostasis protein CutC [Stenotrophomonas sp.]